MRQPDLQPQVYSGPRRDYNCHRSWALPIGRRAAASGSIPRGEIMDHPPASRRRRQLVQGAAAAAAVGSLGFPAIVRGQSDAIRLGHLTPRTGFLGPLGEYAVMGVNLAVDEINAAGGVLGRQFELIAEDSVNPQPASRSARRLMERPHAR